MLTGCLRNADGLFLCKKYFQKNFASCVANTTNTLIFALSNHSHNKSISHVGFVLPRSSNQDEATRGRFFTFKFLSENLTPMAISAIIELSIDASVSGDKYEKASSIALLRTALGKAAERIVVLESLLESERKLRQDDRDFATKNATHL